MCTARVWAGLALIVATAAWAQENPVVGVEKISDTTGGVEGVLADNDRFGMDVAPLVGTTRPGFAVGAHGDDDSGNNAGAVWILFTDGGSPSHLKFANPDSQPDNDLFGVSLASIDDLDGNGVHELVVGAQGDSDVASSSGAVWVLFMGSDGSVLNTQKISAMIGLQANDTFGAAVAGLGDIDGDGHSDVAVGATDDDDGATNAGAVYVLRLDAAAAVLQTFKISAAPGSLHVDLSYGDAFGNVTAIDVNGDDMKELVVGTCCDGAADRGAVYVLFLTYENGSLRIESEEKISASDPVFGTAIDPGDNFGYRPFGIGDLDGDGHVEIGVGAWRDDDGGTDRGALWIVSLHETGQALAQLKISDTAGGFSGGLANGDNFGIGGAAVGDLNGDGPSISSWAPTMTTMAAQTEDQHGCCTCQVGRASAATGFLPCTAHC